MTHVSQMAGADCAADLFEDEGACRAHLLSVQRGSLLDVADDNDGVQIGVVEHVLDHLN